VKKLLLAIVSIVTVYTFCARAAEPKMITTDDLEQKFPPEKTTNPEEEARLLKQNEKVRREYECQQLKQRIADARAAIKIDVSEYDLLKMEYGQKCRGKGSTVYYGR
jgi:hypothetical protein